MKLYLPTIKLFLLMVFVTAFLYPIGVLIIANLTMPWKARGSLIEVDGKIIGSKLIGQKFSKDQYFWQRPSAVDYNTLPAGASNLGPTSQELKETIKKRAIQIAQAHQIQDPSLVPIELICASASGVDPHISLSTAYFQTNRVSKARGFSRDIIDRFIFESIDKPVGLFFGVPHVNVLVLNCLLDQHTNKLSKEKELEKTH